MQNRFLCNTDNRHRCPSSDTNPLQAKDLTSLMSNNVYRDLIKQRKKCTHGADKITFQA